MKLTALALVASALLLVACGDDDTKSSSSSSTSGGTSGTGTSTASLTGTCVTLRDCCPKISNQSSKNGCNIAVSMCRDNQKVCSDTLDDYKSDCP